MNSFYFSFISFCKIASLITCLIRIFLKIKILNSQINITINIMVLILVKNNMAIIIIMNETIKKMLFALISEWKLVLASNADVIDEEYSLITPKTNSIIITVLYRSKSKEMIFICCNTLGIAKRITAIKTPRISTFLLNESNNSIEKFFLKNTNCLKPI